MAETDKVREGKIESTVGHHVKALKGLYIKLPASTYKGIPDRMIILPGPRILFVELKREGGKHRMLQQWWMRRLCGLGCEYHITEGEEGVNQLVKSLRAT